MISYVIFEKNKENDLNSFIQTFPTKNYRYSVAMSKSHTTNEQSLNIVYSTIKLAKFNTIPLEMPIFTNGNIERLFLDSFVLSIQNSDTNVVNWLTTRNYNILSFEDYQNYLITL